MALTVDRLKGRVSTDLSDDELTAMIVEATAAIEERYGAEGERTDVIIGGTNGLDFIYPIDTSKTVSVTEFYQQQWGETSQFLGSDDYRVWYGGRTLERIATGGFPRWRWAQRVEVTYTPVSMTELRDEAIIKLCQLSIEYRPLLRVDAGDYREIKLGYAEEREKIIASIAPRSGMGIA